ncbi:MAG: DNA-3-methyladenine glycosylase [Spirosoma sp.]|nr:DNA-3-methyladenine glycosylase [Spirosoma sp.]
MQKLLSDFYESHDTLTLAQLLLGCELVHESSGGQLGDNASAEAGAPGEITAGIIVETEGYLTGDPACHAYRQATKRNAAMFGPAGTLYVYQIYNHYNCINVVTGPEGVGEAVLIRALEPTQGIERMGHLRNEAFKTGFERYRHKTIDPETADGLKNLANGPGKLAIALGIDRQAHNFSSLSTGSIFIRGPVLHDFEMVTTTRIGITLGTELPYRYYVKGNKFVSKK